MSIFYFLVVLGLYMLGIFLSLQTVNLFKDLGSFGRSQNRHTPSVQIAGIQRQILNLPHVALPD